MGIKEILARVGAVVALLVATGCSSPPYVYDVEEFNRRRPDYGRDPTDIKEVLVCYNKRAATAEAVVRLADERCASVGKRASFHRTALDRCPLLTPVGAVYNCVGPATIGAAPGGATKP